MMFAVRRRRSAAMKTMRRSAAAALVGCLLFTTNVASGQVSPEAAEVLRKAAKAAESLKSIGYSAKYVPESQDKTGVPTIDATVIAVRGSSSPFHRVSIMGSTQSSQQSRRAAFAYACDGATVYWIDHDGKRFSSAPAERCYFLERQAMFPDYFFSASAYDRELKAARVVLEPSQTIGQTPCHVVKVEYDPRGRAMAVFFLGQRDFVLRRIEQRSNQPAIGLSQGSVFSVSSIQVNPTIPDEVFAPKPPAGFNEQPMPSSRVRPVAPPETSTNGKHTGKPATGPLAPEWTLKSMDGRDVRLADLRGRVVLLDFWATWCGPCRMAMPGVQRLHNKFAGKPVSIFGVNCKERGGTERAVQFIKDKGYTYPQLLDNGFVANAYGVRGIPTFVVIGPDGRILFSGSGYSQQQEEKIESIIEAALPR
jgi:thiol-disulfide isomerase/thioredoxin/outer membrane lipoprotein-sorting protein